MTHHERRAAAPRPTQTAHHGLRGDLLSPMTQWLLAAGASGGVVFALVYTLEGITRPGYDPTQQAISALSLGAGGWVQQGNFVVFGLLEILAAVGWRQALRPGVASVSYPLLRGLLGVGLLLAGVFSQDPALGYPPGAVSGQQSVHGMIHIFCAFVIILAIALSAFDLARRFASESRWRVWAPFTILVGIATITFMAIFGSLNAHIGAPAGIFERLAITGDLLLSLAIVGRLQRDRHYAHLSHSTL